MTTMKEKSILKGFSRLPVRDKRRLAARECADEARAEELFASFEHPSAAIQELLSGISENTISNYPLPYNVAPNFLINGKLYMVPMVTEESSVVAAAASAARFWADRGGFRAKVHSRTKNGQLHFLYTGNKEQLQAAFPLVEEHIRKCLRPLTENMEKRGGGLRGMQLKDQGHMLDNYFQLHMDFDTRDAMGANFINSCLEESAEALHSYLSQDSLLSSGHYEPLMAILSNYTDQCLVEVSLSCPLDQLVGAARGLTAGKFVSRFITAVKIAQEDVYRATTHNKGIMNGVDAVILATGNDFRAIEAGAHAWASRSGQYRSLSVADADHKQFRFSLKMPMALGTVGGLTSLHPLAEKSLEMLGQPGADELMMIAAAAGLANNFAAIRSLTSTGIQAGHMRMHLSNITMRLGATAEESQKVRQHFADKKVSQQAVTSYLEQLRKTE